MVENYWYILFYPVQIYGKSHIKSGNLFEKWTNNDEVFLGAKRVLRAMTYRDFIGEKFVLIFKQ